MSLYRCTRHQIISDHLPELNFFGLFFKKYCHPSLKNSFNSIAGDAFKMLLIGDVCIDAVFLMFTFSSSVCFCFLSVDFQWQKIRGTKHLSRFVSLKGWKRQKKSSLAYPSEAQIRCFDGNTSKLTDKNPLLTI